MATPERVLERLLWHMMFRHAWVLFIVVTCANGVSWWWQARKHIRAHPELRAGYRKLIGGWLIFGNLPFLVMGFGILFGGVPTVFDYLNPRNGPFAVTWYVTAVALWVASFFWLFFRRGVETLITHPGLLKLPSNSPWMAKAYLLLCFAGGLVGLLLMMYPDVFLPR